MLSLDFPYSNLLGEMQQKAFAGSYDRISRGIRYGRRTLSANTGIYEAVHYYFRNLRSGMPNMFILNSFGPTLCSSD